MGNSLCMSDYGLPPGLNDIAALAERALHEIPLGQFPGIRELTIAVEDSPDDEMLAELGLSSPWELTGLYKGIPLDQRGIADWGQEPDQVVLFREPILLEWIETGDSLPDLVRTVLIHEIAHHFGFTDEQIEALEQKTRDGAARH
ncbi:Acetylglutamate kinase [Granulibacter bethesdensis]|uniref:Acetylglutamate kinase n=2 Tax=Granulibacter bethesdensis TaxID=364410 RepID=A0AAC9KCN7_9PROT|nr:Acetylglutamate kinase [Granulibacter bethesdensis]